MGVLNRFRFAEGIRCPGFQWARPARVFGLLMVATLAGCMILHSIEVEDPFGFPHRVHIEDEGLECLDCHADVEEADAPSLPSSGLCMLCHEDIDEEQPPEKRIDALFVDGRYVATGVYALEEEIIFSHVDHVGVEDCATCHAGIETNEVIGKLAPLSMDDCMSCHERRGTPNECATCHSVIGEDWKPDSHYQNWTRVHGDVSRGYSVDRADSCSLCHKESDCLSCHQDTPPQSHTNHWRRRGHGIEAQFDRSSCATCHSANTCDRCHEDVVPMNHSGMWGNALNTHCVSCHTPLRSTGCITCHKSTPSHQTATPLPPDHSIALNCRQCHGVSVLLPHVDNGDECILCHQ